MIKCLCHKRPFLKLICGIITSRAASRFVTASEFGRLSFMGYLSLVLILAFSFTAHANTFDQKLFLAKAQNTPIVVVAKVVENKRAVAFWSGLFTSVQTIRYEVTNVLKGKVEKGEICANHYVVKNSRTADLTEPRLLPSLFKEGNQLILLLTLPEPRENSDGESLASPA